MLEKKLLTSQKKVNALEKKLVTSQKTNGSGSGSHRSGSGSHGNQISLTKFTEEVTAKIQYREAAKSESKNITK